MSSHQTFTTELQGLPFFYVHLQQDDIRTIVLQVEGERHEDSLMRRHAD